MTAPAVTTFRRWILQQRSRDDYVGDLARDVEADPERPSFASLAEWMEHLHWPSASDEYRRAILEAWQCFARQSSTRPCDRMPPRRLRYDYVGPGPRAISPRTRQLVFERDAFRCRRCGCGPRDRRLELDHVQPVALGGTSDISNLQTLCNLCNAGKSDREPHPHDMEGL
jgi:5-methylcytosine-specific restriction enzyme A